MIVRTDSVPPIEYLLGIVRITSTAFHDHESIPSKYTCDGEDLIPPLTFSDVPAGTSSLVLIVDDPDAPMGTWDHWVVWNIAPGTAGIREGEVPHGEVGRNSWKKNAWGGPCPPDREHRYFFKLYALNASLDLPRSSTKHDVEKAMKGHVIAEAELVGRYDRKRK